MAEPRMETVLTMVLVASLWAGAMAQSSCTNVIISMSPCLNYITGNSSTPSSGCCTQLASVVRSKPQCLCEVLNGGGSSLGIEINQTRALALPTACSVQTLPISRCNASSPAESPAGTPDSAAGNGSKKVPTTNGNSSDGTSIKSPFSLMFFLIFFASCAATFTSI